MNITAAAAKLTNNSPSVPPSLEQLHQRSTPAEAPATSTRKSFAETFYTRQEEPWTAEKNGWGSPMSREDYVRDQYSLTAYSRTDLQETYEKFLQELKFLDPELSEKNFSYTLDINADIKVLDPKNNLNDDELERLTDAMNKFKGLKELVQGYAKGIMTLVDHDMETFGGKYDISLSNLYRTVDLGSENFRTKYPHNDWIMQIIEKADKRATPLIDVQA